MGRFHSGKKTIYDKARKVVVKKVDRNNQSVVVNFAQEPWDYRFEFSRVFFDKQMTRCYE